MTSLVKRLLKRKQELKPIDKTKTKKQRKSFRKSKKDYTKVDKIWSKRK